MDFEIHLSLTETLLVGVFVLLSGRFIQRKITIFKRFFIPPSVIGGFLFSIIVAVSHLTKCGTITFDNRLASMFMLIFFSTIGFSATFKFLIKGGKAVVLFLICAVLLVILQNILGMSLATLLGKGPLFGLATASIPMTGGHGTAAAFGPILQNKFNVANASTIAVAAATFGLFMGSLIGGPLGRSIMKKYRFGIPEDGDMEITQAGEIVPMEDKKMNITEHGIFDTVVVVSLAIGFGAIISRMIDDFGIILPGYIGAMLVAAIIRNAADSTSFFNVHQNEIEVVGNISLSLFLTLTLMNMQLWVLVDMAVPILILILGQIILMYLFAKYITFNVMGRDYDAAVMACGHCGFGLGATPNGVANMEAFTAQNYPSPQAFFVLPLVGALFIDFVNSGIVSGILNLF